MCYLALGFFQNVNYFVTSIWFLPGGFRQFLAYIPENNSALYRHASPMISPSRDPMPTYFASEIPIVLQILLSLSLQDYLFNITCSSKLYDE